MVALAYPVTVVGVGPGSGEFLLPAAKQAVSESEVLVGGRNALALFPDSGQERRRIGDNLEEILDYIAQARRSRRVAVLMSGDPGFFSLLPRLQARFGAESLTVLPGISSLQLGCARIGLDWHDICCLSVHGRSLNELAKAARCHKVAVLTGSNFSPAAVCRYFLERGAQFDQVWILSDLGLPGETLTSTTLQEGAAVVGRVNSVVVLTRDAGLHEPQVDRKWLDLVAPGLPPELYARGKVAISQEEVRDLTICKARLRRGMVVWEIGAGTGSWTVEVARLVAPGSVYAVERNPAAVRLVQANAERFGLTNIHLTQGEAPQACAGFPPADCILIGGSGGHLADILDQALVWLRPGGVLVVTAVTPDTFSTAWQGLAAEGWSDRQAVLMTVAHAEARGKAQIWQGENPAFILRAKRSL